MAGRDERASERAERRKSRRGSQEHEHDGHADGGDVQSALRGAGAAAIAGAAVGAARALTTRPEGNHDEQDDDHEQADVRGAASAPQRPQERRSERDGRKPTRTSDARRIAAQAREVLRELGGGEAESVSSLTRAGDLWRVTLEVVEVRRVPDSTDVLASYAVELDADGNVAAFERIRRYYRSQAEGGGS